MNYRQSVVLGPGLPIVARRLPRLILPPAAAFILATLGLKHSETLTLHGVGRSALALAIWLFYNVASQSIASIRRYRARRRLGPDVLEVPTVKHNWPSNIDLVFFLNEAREHGYVNDMMAPFVHKMGNLFNLRLFGEDFIFTNEPEHVKAILSTEFTNFVKGQATREKMDTILGEGVFNVDGEMWKFHRSMTRPYFSRERISHFELFARHSEIAISKLLSRLAEQPSDGTSLAVDFQDLASRFTMDSASEFLFGINARSLDEPLPYPHIGETTSHGSSIGFAAAFANVQNQAVARFIYGSFWPYLEMFWDRTSKDMRVVDEFVMPVLQAKLEKRKQGAFKQIATDGEDNDNETLLDHLVRLTDNEKLIKDELLNILLAGRDTTASTLTFTCYMLASHPDVLSKLRTEILAVVGATAYPTFDHFREMKYLRAVLNEVFRLFPPVPFNQRRCVNSTVLNFEGKRYFIPAGATVMYAVQFIHTRKDLWGPDADDFDPERWLDERCKKYVLPNPFIFLPFNAGPRICLGQQFAYNEASFFLVRLLQRVDEISLAPDAQPVESHPPKAWAGAPGRKGIEKIWPKAHLTMYSVGGLWVRMKEATTD